RLAPKTRLYMLTGWTRRSLADDPRRSIACDVLDKPIGATALRRVLADLDRPQPLYRSRPFIGGTLNTETRRRGDRKEVGKNGLADSNASPAITRGGRRSGSGRRSSARTAFC